MNTGYVLERAPAGRDTGQRSVSLQRRRVYIFPSRQGILYGVVLLVMLVGAINYSNSMAYLLVFTLGSAFLVCMLHTYRNLRGLVIHIQPAPPVFAGDAARFPVLLDNRAGVQRPGIVIRPAGHRGRPRSQAEDGHWLDVPGSQLQQEAVAVASRRRGLLRAGRLRLETAWPLGLFRAWSYIEGDAAAVIYPRPAGNPALPDLAMDSHEYQSGRLGGADDFTGFRPYRPGDSIRNIDWKVLAREQGVLIRRFSGSGMQRLILSWDHTAHLPDTERRLSQLCLWVVEAEQQGLHYGLDIPGTELPLGHGGEHEHRCLKALAIHGLGDNP
jgi:uncharacterized protein (DUF58 family)